MEALASRRVVIKPWGKLDIGAFRSQTAATDDQPVGEIWFEPDTSDVLVKYLFTSERLSIQVHPDDEQARTMNGIRGKEECWLILEADPGAHVGIGLTKTVSQDELKRAALDGSVVDLISWREARVGDFIYNPARTIHALGPGLTVLEIQQNSDITLRLFDYFRARALHVDQAVAISRLEPHYHRFDRRIDFSQTTILSDGPKFGFAFCRGTPPQVPINAFDFRLITWNDSITVHGGVIPPGCCVKLQSPEEIRETADGRFFLAWSIAPSN